MPTRGRHHRPKPGKPSATHLPAVMARSGHGEATLSAAGRGSILGRMGGYTFGFRRWGAWSAGKDSESLAELQRSDSQYEEWDLIPAPIQPANAARADAAAIYWRRRFAVLVIGLVAFGLAAWGLSSAIAVHPHPPGHAGQGRGAGAGPPRPVRDHAPGVRRSGQAHETPGGHRKSAGSGGQAADRRAASPSAASPARADVGRASGHGTILPAFCARKSIVISIFTGQTQFGRRQSPAFDLNVVSTQPTECSFNLGSRHLTLVIKEGPARIWSSADCAPGTAGLIAALKRGIPTVLAVTWNRRTSAPGCSGRVAAVPPGVYTAYATDDGLSSDPVTFRLS